MKSFAQKNPFPFCAAVFFSFLILVPRSFALQNPPEGGCFVYPSPAQGSTAWVVFNLPESGTANVYIYNEAGDLVAETQLWNNAGLQQVPLDLTHYRSGVYVCRVALNLDSGSNSVLQLFKFIVVK